MILERSIGCRLRWGRRLEEKDLLLARWVGRGGDMLDVLRRLGLGERLLCGENSGVVLNKTVVLLPLE